MARTFRITDGIRGSLPLMLGLGGPSRSGKTYSALRLATGIQSVVGGTITVIDTESSRALHYSNKFAFRHLAFAEPFCPLDYLSAIQQAKADGASIIIVDSMSHEHEGPGGVLEQHSAEQKRLAAAWQTTEMAVTLPAWAEPKARRRRLINSVTQLGVHLIICFRAKQKVKLLKPKERAELKTKEPMQELGWMIIGGDEFMYEMGVRFLLLPGAEGVPTWHSDMPGEREWIGIDEPFRPMFCVERQLDEKHGIDLAQWATGSPDHSGRRSEKSSSSNGIQDERVSDLLSRYEAVSSLDEMDTITGEIKALAKSLSRDNRDTLGRALKSARERLAGGTE